MAYQKGPPRRRPGPARRAARRRAEAIASNPGFAGRRGTGVARRNTAASGSFGNG